MMFNKKILIIFSILILILLCGSVSAQKIDDFKVTQTENNNLNESSIVSTDFSLDELKTEGSDEIIVNDWNELQYYCSLEDKDYTLRLKENTNFYPTSPTDSNYQIKINNNVKIIGSKGAYIGDDSSDSRLISYTSIIVPEGNRKGLTLENITFKWIHQQYQPDAIFINLAGNGNYLIKNCHFENIQNVIGNGAVITLKKGSATIENCSFINCNVPKGIIDIYGKQSVIVKDCYFANNYGYEHTTCIKNYGNLKVFNTKFYKNRSAAWAGGITTYDQGVTDIYNCNFTGNVAGWNGGALYCYNIMNIYNSTFIDNNCTTNNGGGAIGACQYQGIPRIYIENSLFKDNNNLCWGLDELSTTGTGRGGAISFMDVGSIEVRNSLFIGNSASMGTAICAIAVGGYGSPDIIIVNNTFINHTRVGDVLNVSVFEGSLLNVSGNYYLNNSIEFSELSLTPISIGKEQATLQVNVSLSNPNYYEDDILDKTLYDVYINNKYVKTVNTTEFLIDFGDLDICDVYVIPTISNRRSNVVTVASTREYVFVSKNGSDNNAGITRDSPVRTIKKALDLARDCQNIILLDGDYNETVNINYDVTLKGEGNATLTDKMSFNVNSNFTLKNLKINNLNTDAFIKQNNNNLLISNCILTNNDALIVRNNGFATIINSILLNNSDILEGNADYVLDCNWWGSLLPDLNISKYITLNITGDVGALENNQKANVKAVFYLNDGSKYTKLPEINLDITTLNGIVNKNITTVDSNVVYTLTGFSDGVLTVSYNDFSISKTFVFLKTDSDMSITAEDIMFGDILNVTIALPSDVEGNLIVSVGNISQSKVIESSKTVFTFPNLKADEYSISASYSGDKKYMSKTITDNVNVNKYESKTNLNISNIEVGEDVTLTITTTDSSTGIITLSINNDIQTLDLNNSKVNYTIKNIKRGDYRITALYNGDDKYLASTDSIFIEVDNLNATISINTQDIIYGDVEIIGISLNEDATGEVTATIDGVTNTSKVINGKAELTFYNLDAGFKNVVVFYTGDDTYFNLTEYSNFTIDKANFTFDVSSTDIMIGQVAEIIIQVVPKTMGAFTIGDDVITIPLSGLVTYSVEDLEIGNYTYTVTYNGNNYNTVSNTTGFRVLEYPIPQVPNEGLNTQNTHKSDYETNVNGEVAFHIPLNETLTGDLVIDSLGNVYLTTQNGIYAFNQTSQLWHFISIDTMGNFSGIAISRDVIIMPISGDTLYFINQTAGERYGVSNIYQGSSLFAPVVDANANLYIVSEYQYSSQDYKLTIVPYRLWESGGNPTLIGIGNTKPLCSPTLDENVIVIVSDNRIRLINTKTLETISIKSGNFQAVRPVIGEGSIVYAVLSDSIVAYNSNGVQVWKTKVTGKVGNILAIDPEQAVYHVNAKKLLYKYDIIDGSESKVSDLKVTSGLLIGSDGTLYFGSNNMFYALDSQGNILWRSDVGCEITGNPVMDKNGLIYITTENGITALTHADLKDPEITINVSDIFVGEDATVTISVNGQCLGDLIITFGNETFTEPITSQGIVSKTFSNLKAGLHTVNVEFSGDVRFDAGNVSANFTVNKYVPDLTVSCEDIFVGEDAVFTVNITEATTGEIKLEINNRTYICNASIIRVPNLGFGTYNYTLSYVGDERYEQMILTGSINVSKVTVPEEIVNITVPEGGDGSSYSISLPKDATGNLTVIVDGEKYSQTLVNGSATVSVPELSNGTHNITVTYSGDEKYSPITKTSVVNVTKKDSQSNQTEHVPIFKLTASNLKMLYASGQYFKVRLTKDNMPVQGEAVKFIIGDNVYTRYTDSNGYASLKIGLAPNTYKVKAKYANLKTTNKVTVKSIVNAYNVKAKKSAKTLKIKVTLSKVNGKYLKYKWVTLKFNNKKLKVKTNKKGVAIFTIKNKVYKNLKIGKKYTYQVFYGKDTAKKTIKFKK